jgi:hypothetical protein
MTCNNFSQGLPWLLLAAAWWMLIVYAISVGKTLGGKGSGKLIIERSDDPFSFWTQIAVGTVLGLVISLAAWRAVGGCFSS